MVHSLSPFHIMNPVDFKKMLNNVFRDKEYFVEPL